jgi:hypothetical protein
MATATFTIGSTASAISACDSDCVWVFEVVKRTPQFVTLRDVTTGDTTRTKVQTSRQGDEWTLPFGSFSMAPVAIPGAAR